MASVVFMRGVNVGGHKAFRPSVLAGQLAALRVVSIGAAGTFIVRAHADAARIRREFARRLPFEGQLIVCRARDVIDLLEADPFASDALPTADGQFISVVERRPRTLPRLPVCVPDGRSWQVWVLGIHGRFVATLLRKSSRSLVYPNEVVEKLLGVAATTRGWSTILR